LLKKNKLSITKGSPRENLTRELHSGGLSVHFGHDKTRDLFEERYFWPSIGKYVRRLVEGYMICYRAK
jgi:hypothetical protein